VIKNSHGKRSIAFSPEISDALKALKDFNLERIYMNPKSKIHSATIQQLFARLFETRLKELETNRHDSDIFSGFLADMSESYIAGHTPAEIVRDYIAGMTDRYFLHQFPEHLRPVAPL
jgi:dGTPase